MTPSPLESAREVAARPAQIHLHLEGDIDFARIQAAWRNLVESKEELRDGLSPNGNSQKYKQRPLPWQQYDLRGLPAERARIWLKSFLETDRGQGIPADRFWADLDAVFEPHNKRPRPKRSLGQSRRKRVR